MGERDRQPRAAVNDSGAPVASSGTRDVAEDELVQVSGPPEITEPLDGRYEVGAPLGKGGMGWVFEGIDRRLKRRLEPQLEDVSAKPSAVAAE